MQRPKHVISLVYDSMNESVKAQIVRDMLLLTCEFPNTDLEYRDTKGLVDPLFLKTLGVANSPEGEGDPELYIVYKTGKDWQPTPVDVTRVERDLRPDDASPTLDDKPRVGYFLKPQGRTGANMTLRYLSRSYPKGRGFVHFPWLLN